MCYYCVFLCYRQACSTVAIPGNRRWGYCALCHHLHLWEEEEPWDGGWSWWWWWSCVSALYISWSSEYCEWDKMQNWSANQLFWLKKWLKIVLRMSNVQFLLIKKIFGWGTNQNTSTSKYNSLLCLWCFFFGGGGATQLSTN